MHDGHIAGVLDAAAADRMELGRLMLGAPAPPVETDREAAA
jgi:hypothetical protein